MIAVEYQGITYPSKVALSSANLQKVSMQDHRGNMFSSVREICKYYQVTNSAFYRALETKTVQQYTEHREKFLRNKGLWEH